MLVLIPTLFVLVFILNLVFRVRNAARNTFRREPKREQPRYDYDESDNPIADETKVNEEVALKWLKNGAQPSDTVRNLLSKAGIMKKFAEQKQGK